MIKGKRVYRVAPIRSPGVYFFSSLSGWASIREGRLLGRGVYCFHILNLTACYIILMQMIQPVSYKYLLLGTQFIYDLGWAFIREGRLFFSANCLGGLLLGRGVY